MKSAGVKARTAISAILATVIGTVAGAILLYVGFSENSQGEYYDPLTKAIDLPYAAHMFLTAFLLTALTVFAASFLLSAYIFKKS